ncbi:MAG: M28 family peptidase [Candidatus Eremiobacteraeota bacterium]|nr:M28 family peptidase [Candidatus Eremiobacteraeota bacterium]
MNYRRFFSALALLAMVAQPAVAAPPARDPQIMSMVSAVSTARIRAINEGLLAFGTRNAYSEQSTDPKRGVFAARNWIKAQFEQIAQSAGGRMSVAYDEYTQPKTDSSPRAVFISSVIATLKGDDPSGRTYVISSHYDSRNSDGYDAIKDAPGANDNGSGVCAVLEAARVMATHRFSGTIIFAAYDGEEQGLFGSGHHAKTLHDAGVPVAANLNNDIMGSSAGHDGEHDPYEVRVFSEAIPVNVEPRRVNLLGSENDSSSRDLARFVKSVSETYVPNMHARLIFRSDRFLRGGDQQSFAAQGFAAIRFVEPHENYVHQHQDVRVENGIQYGDLPQYVDFDYLTRVTKMNVAALAMLALAPAAPQQVEMLTKQLSYDTTLRWHAVPNASAYEVVWRNTAAPVWEHVRNVGNVTQVTVKASKDDFVFGVRALDAQGHVSPAVFPIPVKE